VGEEAWCTGAGERKAGEMRDGIRRCLFMAVRAGRKRVGGVQLVATWGQEQERRGRGRGATPRDPAQHGHGGSRPLGQQRVAHVARARRARCEQGRRRA
jgi:hypothetical protein